MKSQLRLYKILALAVLVIILPPRVIALEEFLSTTVSVTASTVFSMEFYVDQNVIYSTTVPFSNVDPQESMVYPNGRAENDGKSDTGVVCITNMGDPWYLQIQGVYSEGLPEDSVKYYYSQPWNRNTGQETTGSLSAGTVDWRAVPSTPSTIYTSGADDTINTPFGTLSTFSFAVDPRGLSADMTYTVSVTYTMTTAP